MRGGTGNTGGNTGANQTPQTGSEGGGGGAQPAGTAINTGQKQANSKEVTFWTQHSEPDLSVIRQIVSDFNKANPDIFVKLVQVAATETETTKLTTAVRGGVGPDVYMLDRFIVAQRAADGLLQDLSPHMGGRKLTDMYVGFAAAEATFEDKPYALPFDTDARALYYRKDVLNEAGVDPAELDPKNGPVTWDRVKQMAMKVNKRDQSGNYTRMGFVPYFDQGWHYTYGFSYGGNFYDEQKCEVTPTDSGVVEGFQYVYDYSKNMDAKKMNAFIQPAMRQDASPAQHPFVTGRVALDITGDWHINTMEQYNPKADYGITYLPVPKKGDKSVTWAGGWSLVMPQGAKQPEAAAKFMHYFAGEQGQKVYTKQARHLPTIKSLQGDESLYDERHKIFIDLIKTAKNRPPLPVGALYWDELTRAWQNTYLNTAQPKQALQQVAERVNPQLKQFCQ